MMEAVELKPGMKLAGRYLLQEHLGHGGMGTVWLAKDEKLDDTPVATKLLLPDLARDTQFVNSLKEEAISSMQLSHPNIVQVHGLHHDDQDDNVAFLVLKYIKGGTMKEVLQDWPGGVPVERVLRWAKDLGSALDYAHAQGVVHRDIKPSNIMIDSDTDQAMLMDFGISRQCDQTIRSGQDASQTGIGTLAFMSPQQLHDKDSKSNDIYSLSATLYKALSGRAPFIGDAIEEQILRQDPKPIEGVSDAVNRALLAGLAKEEVDRPETADDLIDLLMMDSLVPETRQPIAPSHNEKRKGSLLPKLAVAAVVIGGAVFAAMNYDQIKEYFQSEDTTVAESTTPATSDPIGGDPVPGKTGIPGQTETADSTGGESSGSVIVAHEPENDQPAVDEVINDAARTNPTGPVASGSETPSNVPSSTDEPVEVDMDDGTPDVFHVVRRGDVDDLESALKQSKRDGRLTTLFNDVDPNTGHTVMHAAASAGRVDMLAVLLEHGGDANASNSSMPRVVKPIHVAAENGRVEAIVYLIGVGADVNARDGGLRTALHLAAKRCRNMSDVSILQKLVEAGADTGLLDNRGKTALELVPITSSVRENAKEVLS